MLDAGVSIGTAAEIKYDDAKRLITYNSPRWSRRRLLRFRRRRNRISAARRATSAAIVSRSRSGEHGRAKQLEAYTNVVVRVDTRVATGARLT